MLLLGNAPPLTLLLDYYLLPILAWSSGLVRSLRVVTCAIYTIQTPVKPPSTLILRHLLS